MALFHVAATRVYRIPNKIAKYNSSSLNCQLNKTSLINNFDNNQCLIIDYGLDSYSYMFNK